MLAPEETRKAFKPDREKILESILYLINRRNEKPGQALSQYDIVKAIFLADVSHLNKYGRPVTFDNYVAMEHGPVPTLTYDTLKPASGLFARLFQREKPWTTLADGKIHRFVKADRPHNKDVLSATDLEALDYGLQTVTNLSFGQLKKLTHEHPAYIEAWARRGTADASDIDMQRLLDNAKDDDETIERIAYTSRHVSSGGNS
ncbi:MAG TPA: Panacea domain-containing protein [Xanthobacteraceae bacterium]|nr:Panacea domain-containing protein [Xanthobacteraceae bacterium]